MANEAPEYTEAKIDITNANLIAFLAAFPADAKPSSWNDVAKIFTKLTGKETTHRAMDQRLGPLRKAAKEAREVFEADNGQAGLSSETPKVTPRKRTAAGSKTPKAKKTKESDNDDEE